MSVSTYTGLVPLGVPCCVSSAFSRSHTKSFSGRNLDRQDRLYQASLLHKYSAVCNNVISTLSLVYMVAIALSNG